MRCRDLHNADSPDSSLKVDYILNLKNNSITISAKKLNRVIQNPKIIRNNNERRLPDIKRYINPVRIDQFNSYSNENMDFFRLDYLSESKSQQKHNAYFDNLTPINRNENYQKINEIGERIKYFDSLKKKQTINSNDKISHSIDILNPKMNLSEDKKDNEIENKNNNNHYANLYLANLNDYSINEDYHTINKLQKKTKQRVIFPIILNKNNPCDYVAKENFHDKGNSRFYQNYHKNFEDMGFMKQKGPCAYFDNINKNKFFFRKDKNKLEPINKKNTNTINY